MTKKLVQSAFLLLLFGILGGGSILPGAVLAEDPADSEVVDLKPHYAPLAAVELFVVGDCKVCLKTLQTLNGLEANAGNRRGQVIFLTYVLARNPAEERAYDQTGSKSREQVLKRWTTYGDIFKLRHNQPPWLIVNGGKFFASSKPELLEKVLNRALARPTKVALSIELGKVSLEGIRVSYSVHGLPKSRSDDLYHLTIAAVKPHTNVPIYTVDGMEPEETWANLVEACDLVRIEEDDSGEVDLHFPEQVRPDVKELVALLQDARTGKPVAGEMIRIKLPSPSR